MSGSYRVEVSIHTYDNPTGRCDECQPGPDPGCCDETSVRPADEPCSISSTCDPIFGYKHCGIDTRNNGYCEGVESTNSKFTINTNSVDFNSTWLDFELDNPVIVEESAPWNVSDF